MCRDERPNSPAAVWYIFFFFAKKLLFEQLFCEKDGSIVSFLEKTWFGEPRFFQKERMSGTILPEATFPFWSGTA